MIYAGGMWYLTRSEDSKVTEHGIWKPKGDPLRVLLNSSISGWKTTLEFCELRASEVSKTNWIMQEYKITSNGSNCETRAKVTRSVEL